MIPHYDDALPPSAVRVRNTEPLNTLNEGTAYVERNRKTAPVSPSRAAIYAGSLAQASEALVIEQELLKSATLKTQDSDCMNLSSSSGECSSPISVPLRSPRKLRFADLTSPPSSGIVPTTLDQAEEPPIRKFSSSGPQRGASTFRAASSSASTLIVPHWGRVSTKTSRSRSSFDIDFGWQRRSTGLSKATSHDDAHTHTRPESRLCPAKRQALRLGGIITMLLTIGAMLCLVFRDRGDSVAEKIMAMYSGKELLQVTIKSEWLGDVVADLRAISTNGGIGSLYVFNEGGPDGEAWMLKLPQQAEDAKSFKHKAAIPGALAAMGIKAPIAEVVQVSLEDEDGSNYEITGLLMQMLYGVSMVNVLEAFGAGGMCLVKGKKLSGGLRAEGMMDYAESISHQISHRQVNVRKVLGLAKADRTATLDRIRNSLKCFLSMFSYDLGSHSPRGVMTHLSGANFLWATSRSRDVDKPSLYELWLVDVIFHFPGSSQFQKLSQDAHASDLWLRHYYVPWRETGFGQCQSSTWPILKVHSHLAGMESWIGACHNVKATEESSSNYPLLQQVGSQVVVNISSCSAGTTTITVELLSNKSLFGLIYACVRPHRCLLKLPRSSGEISHLELESASSRALSAMGVITPVAETCTAEFIGDDGHQYETQALLKQLIFGFSLDEVIRALTYRYDSGFDDACFDPGNAIFEYSKSVVSTDWTSIRGKVGENTKVLYHIKRNADPAERAAIAKRLRAQLSCFFGQVADDLSSGQPRGLLVNITAKNFMWATQDRKSMTNIAAFKLWLVDSEFNLPGSQTFYNYVQKGNPDSLWQALYASFWESSGPGRCQSKIWPQLKLPERKNEAVLLTSACHIALPEVQPLPDDYPLPMDKGSKLRATISSIMLGQISVRAHLLSGRGRSGILYAFLDKRKKRAWVLKLPRSPPNSADFPAEATLALVAIAMGIRVPITELTKAQFTGSNEQRYESPALVKELLYGHDLDVIIRAISSSDANFDDSCLARLDHKPTDQDYRNIEMQMMGGKKRAFDEVIFFEKKRRRQLADAIQGGLKCFFGRIARDLLLGAPRGFFLDLTAQNFMWATKDKAHTSVPGKYRLYLVDAYAVLPSSEMFKHYATMGRHEIWKQVYADPWANAGPGTCQSKHWPIFQLPSDITVDFVRTWLGACSEEHMHFIH